MTDPTQTILTRWLPQYYVYTQLRAAVNLVLENKNCTYLIRQVHKRTTDQRVRFNYILTSPNIDEEKRTELLQDMSLQPIYELINSCHQLIGADLILIPTDVSLISLNNMELVFIWQLLVELNEQCLNYLSRPLDTNTDASLCQLL